MLELHGPACQIGAVRTLQLQRQRSVPYSISSECVSFEKEPTNMVQIRTYSKPGLAWAELGLGSASMLLCSLSLHQQQCLHRVLSSCLSGLGNPANGPSDTVIYLKSSARSTSFRSLPGPVTRFSTPSQWLSSRERQPTRLPTLDSSV
ncbi:putative membrane protein [Fusarium oxysporum f. sp. albedinis]|nr:putative membrane protein [Fusarium oxysporum f. sp. albedinis]